MGNFKQNKGKRFDRGPVTMHKAVCDQCGRPCEVPFRPTSGKPVYCNVCFGKKREIGSNRGGDRFPQKRQDNNDELKKQLVILNAKMDQLIKAVEAMANTKPLRAGKTVPIAKVKKSKKRVSKNR